MITCGVCGSANEAEALFCGTCGSPLKRTDDGLAETTATPTPTPEEEGTTPGKSETTSRQEAIPGGEKGQRELRPDGRGTPPKPQPETGEAEVGTETELEIAAGATVTCQVCGTINDATRTYCRKCANELKPMPGPPPVPEPTPVRKRIPPLAIALGAAGVVLAGGAIVLLLSGAIGGPGASPSSVAQVTPGASTPTESQGAASAEPTQPPFDEGDPEGRIVFSRCEPGEPCVLMLIDAAGGGATALTDPDSVGSATDPGFAHDGNQVAFSTPEGIRILSLDSGEIAVHSRTPGDANADWSPDDLQILFSGARDRDDGPVDDREIRIDSVDRVPSQPLTVNGVEDHDPVFTIDGESVIWVRGRGNNRELWRMNIASGELAERLTRDDFNDVDPAVSPDGTRIVFVSNRGGGDDFDLWLMDLATLDVTALPDFTDGDAHDPAWSPGGRYIVFSGGDDESTSLYLLDLADGSFEALTEGDGRRDLAPAWRP